MMSFHTGLQPAVRSGPNFLDQLFRAALSDYHRRAGAHPLVTTGECEEVHDSSGCNQSDNLNYYSSDSPVVTKGRAPPTSDTLKG